MSNTIITNDNKDTITYNAYISGRSYQDEQYPTLDSINVHCKHQYYQTNTTTTIQKIKPQKRFKVHIQPQAGWGYGLQSKKTDIYIGIGVGLTIN